MKANYDLIAEKWVKNRTQIPAKDLQLFDIFISKLPRNGKILDLGCGSGTPIAKLLANSGFSVLGVDRSEKLLEVAKNTLPDIAWVHADIDSYAIDTSYDGIVIWDALFHIPHKDHKAILEKIHNGLSEQGLVILSSGGSEAHIPSFTDTMFDVEFFYDSYSISELVKLCEAIGFNVIMQLLVDMPDGLRNKGRLGLVLEKA